MLRLYRFPNSHFCEKVAWALEHKGISYQPIELVRLLHVRRLRRLGCAETSVPVVERAGVVVQGSDAILTWLDERFPERGLTPEDPAERERALSLELEIGEPLGHHLRRAMLASAVRHPPLTRFVFGQGLTSPMSWMMPAISPLIAAGIRRGQAGAGVTFERERDAALALLDALEAALGERDYLVGGRFSRADLSLAALLSPVVWPDEHPLPWPPPDLLPDALAGFRETQSARRVWSWALEIYRRHRPVG